MTRLKKSASLIDKHKTVTWVLANPLKTIVLSGIIIRVIILFLYRHITVYPDSSGYYELAARLLNFNLKGYEGQRSPGYPLLLALANSSNTITVAVQMAMGILSAIVAYKTLVLSTKKPETALVATLLITSYMPIVFFELAILTETLTLFVILMLFHFLLSYRFDNNRNTLLLIGLLSGYLVLIKPFYIFLPIAFACFIAFESKGFKDRTIRFIAVLVLPLCVFLGWSYINKLNTGYFVSTTYYGFNLSQNCVRFAENTPAEFEEIGQIYAYYRDHSKTDKELAMTVWEAYPRLQAETGLSFPDLSKLMYTYSIATIKNNPFGYFRQVAISWRDFWKTSLYWEYDQFKIPYASTAVLYICYAQRILFQLIKIVFVLLIPYNIVRFFKKKQLSPQIIISVVVLMASILQALVTYGTNSRFSYPFEILILISVLLNIYEFRKDESLNKKS